MDYVSIHTGSKIDENIAKVDIQEIEIETLKKEQYAIKWTRNFTTAYSFNNNTDYNLMADLNSTLVTLSGNILPTDFVYTNSGQTTSKVVSPIRSNVEPMNIEIRINGTVPSGSSGFISARIERAADNSLVTTGTLSRNAGSLANESILLTSAIVGNDDPYVSTGWKIILRNQTGTTVTVNSITMLLTN